MFISGFSFFYFVLTSVLRLVLLFSFLGSTYNLTYGSGISDASLIGRFLKGNHIVPCNNYIYTSKTIFLHDFVNGNI